MEWSNATRLPDPVAVMTAAQLGNPDAIAAGAAQTGVDVAIAATLAHQESSGRMIYGHDKGGVFSTLDGPVLVDGVSYPKGADVPVTASNYLQFEKRVLAGGGANGVGIMQITWAGSKRADGTRSGGYLTEARRLGLDLSKPLDNVVMGLRIIRPDLEAARQAGLTGDDVVRRAAVTYNAGSFTGWQTHWYGVQFMAKYATWVGRFAPIPDPVADLEFAWSVLSRSLSSAAAGADAAEGRVAEALLAVTEALTAVSARMAEVRAALAGPLDDAASAVARIRALLAAQPPA